MNFYRINNLKDSDNKFVANPLKIQLIQLDSVSQLIKLDLCEIPRFFHFHKTPA